MSSSNCGKFKKKSPSKCESCLKQFSKYKCPKCFIKYCSLSCYRTHFSLPESCGSKSEEKSIMTSENGQNMDNVSGVVQTSASGSGGVQTSANGSDAVQIFAGGSGDGKMDVNVSKDGEGNVCVRGDNKMNNNSIIEDVKIDDDLVSNNGCDTVNLTGDGQMVDSKAEDTQMNDDRLTNDGEMKVNGSPSGKLNVTSEGDERKETDVKLTQDGDENVDLSDGEIRSDSDKDTDMVEAESNLLESCKSRLAEGVEDFDQGIFCAGEKSMGLRSHKDTCNGRSTDEKICKDTSTDEKICKDTSTDEKIFKDRLTDENICKDTATDEKLHCKDLKYQSRHQVTDRETYKSSIEELTEDQVTEERIKDLETCEELQKLLGNKHLRDMLINLDSSSNISHTIEAAMQEPIFREYATVCLQVIEGERTQPAL